MEGGIMEPPLACRVTLASAFAPVLATAAVLATMLGWSMAARAEDGVFPDRIAFGQVAALSGPAQGLGLGMREGLLAAFAEVDRAGGIDGRKLELTSEDDGYEPDRAIVGVKQLIDVDHVFALVGSVGTPTSAATKPIAEEAAVPFIGAFTGAELLRTPFQRNVVNLRGSYFQETEEMVNRLTTDLGIKRIAVLYQDDAFGRAGYDGTVAALKKRGMALAAEGVFERNTTAVRAGLLQVRRADPEALLVIGPYQPVAEIVRLAHRIKLDTVILTLSFVGADALAQELGPEGNNVVVTEVVPFPRDRSLPVVAHYQDALKISSPAAEPGFVSLEGYLVGRMVIDILRRTGKDLTRQAFLSTIYNQPEFDIDGLRLTFGPTDNQGLDDVFLTVLKDGKVMPATDLKGVRR
jgi:branched-chain amino acid transport system substrate-binding protein